MKHTYEHDGRAFDVYRANGEVGRWSVMPDEEVEGALWLQVEICATATAGEPGLVVRARRAGIEVERRRATIRGALDEAARILVATPATCREGRMALKMDAWWNGEPPPP